jgi:hypothetical protein
LLPSQNSALSRTLSRDRRYSPPPSARRDR